MSKASEQCFPVPTVAEWEERERERAKKTAASVCSRLVNATRGKGRTVTIELSKREVSAILVYLTRR